MFPTTSKQASTNKPKQTIGSSKRHQPRPKVFIRLSPPSKTPLNTIERKQVSSGKLFHKKKESGKLDHQLHPVYPEINSKSHFHSEMKAFVQNKEKEKQKAQLRAKIGVICNLMQCVSPFDDHEKISYDFIQEFLAVGKDIYDI